MTGPAAVEIVLSERERGELETRVRRRKIARADAIRAQIVLLAAVGLNNCAIADEIGASRMTVLTWRKRFAAQRLDGLDDEPRCGAPRKIGDDKITDVVTKTLETMPSHATHWSTRSMARASGLSVSTVHRIWNAFSLQPHLAGAAPARPHVDKCALAPGIAGTFHYLGAAHNLDTFRQRFRFGQPIV
jgi:transposase